MKKLPLTQKEESRLYKLEEKNSEGKDPRLTPKEELELQVLLDKRYSKQTR